MGTNNTNTLNPYAPEYYPIPPGVAPNPDAPPPPFFHPQPIAASRQRFRPPPTSYFIPTPTLLPRPHTNYYPVPENRPKRTRRRGDRRSGRDGGARCMHKKDQVMPLNRDDEKTTVMIKNIPYDCPREDLMRLVDGFCLMENCNDNQGFVSAYDFLYLPIDFSTNKGRGFAFVNFTNAAAAWKFYQAFHRKNWAHAPNWPKQIEIVAAKFQGKDALVNHISKSKFECETDEYLPMSFEPARDGSGQVGQVTAIGIRRARWEARRNH